MSKSEPKVVLVAITKHGAKNLSNLAPLLKNADVLVSEKFKEVIKPLDNNSSYYDGALKSQIEKLMSHYDQIIFFISLGAVVRLIAPHIKSKDVDPGVLVVDDQAQFVIPVLSGHVGGANSYAELVATLLKAQPVLTTASDVSKTIPVDILGRELGWKVEAPKINITRVSADVVNEEPIAFVQEAGNKNWWTRQTPLPKNIQLFSDIKEVDLTKFASVLWVTHKNLDETQWQELHERLVVYRPPSGTE